MTDPGSAARPPGRPKPTVQPTRSDIKAERATTLAAKFCDGDRIEIAALMAIPWGHSGSGDVLMEAMPLFMLWRRIARSRNTAAAGGALGVPLRSMTLLILTDRRLLFCSVKKVGRGRRVRYEPVDALGAIDRSLVLSVTSSTVGRGWRTCRLSLRNGAEVAARVPSWAVDRLVAAF